MSEKTGLALLRQPFPEHQISYLPKGGVKLAYVGHAALTDRLLDADPAWHWEPLSMSTDGLPVMDDRGGMWIKLTICGVTRLGYGHAGTKTGGDAIKEIIGDALRNAAMRFGAALDLWHKGDLHVDEEAKAPRAYDLTASIKVIKSATTVDALNKYWAVEVAKYAAKSEEYNALKAAASAHKKFIESALQRETAEAT